MSGADQGVARARVELERCLAPDRLSATAFDLDRVSRDESSLPPGSADLVVFPESTAEVAAVTRIARETRTPLTARGGGTSLEGNPIPVLGGIVLDLGRMNRLLDVSPIDLYATVQPGLSHLELNRRLADFGLFFSATPGGTGVAATVGGLIANNASGIYSLRYGSARRSLLACEVVTGTGDVLRAGGMAPRRSSGYDLPGLLAGSEGTLGILTELTVSLHPVPESRRRSAAIFPTDDAAARAIGALRLHGLDLAAIELVNREAAALAAAEEGVAAREGALVLIEVHGSASAAAEISVEAGGVCRDGGGAVCSDAAAAQLWRCRERLTAAVRRAIPDARVVRADLGAPVSRLPELISWCDARRRAKNLALYIFGHGGVGILHALLPVPADSSAEADARDFRERLIERAVSLGGTVSAEHGIGIGNRHLMRLEHGEALGLMSGIKKLFDPEGVLNPGKVLPIC
ncbi:MAG: FAD-binding oxidoreductase [Candidatus Schekmanbacteria bacterium]|nr:FAD-binding oxidoreductase [Candidatus Schekmanbacteria bacterium]